MCGGRSRTDSFSREDEGANYRFILAGVEKERILLVERRKERILLCSSMGRSRQIRLEEMAEGTEYFGSIGSVTNGFFNRGGRGTDFLSRERGPRCGFF